jgi:hypothetical protein
LIDKQNIKIITYNRRITELENDEKDINEELLDITVQFKLSLHHFKNEIIKDLLNEEELKIPKDQEYCIRGVICFVGSPFKNGRTRAEFSGLVFYFDIDESFLGIAVKYRLDEKYKRTICFSECK